MPDNFFLVTLRRFVIHPFVEDSNFFGLKSLCVFFFLKNIRILFLQFWCLSKIYFFSKSQFGHFLSIILKPHSMQTPSPTSFSIIRLFLLTYAFIPKNSNIPIMIAKITVVNGISPITKSKIPTIKIISRFSKFN